MAKAVKKKTLKKRASKYEDKLIINGTFEDVITVSVTGTGVKKSETKNKK